jgi:FCD domain-containing protein
VENTSDAQRKALQKQMAVIERLAARGQSILKPKDRFYEILFTGGGNLALHQTASSLHARVRALRSLSLSVPGRTDESRRELQESCSRSARATPSGRPRPVSSTWLERAPSSPRRWARDCFRASRVGKS